MKQISMRELQQMSASKIAKLKGPTPILSGTTVMAEIRPLRRLNKTELKKLDAALAAAKRLREARDPKEDARFFASNPDLDPRDWTLDEVRRAFDGKPKRPAKRK